MKFSWTTRISTLFFALLFTVVSCSDYNELDLEPINSGSADFSKYVAVGNSLTAGFQSNALYESAQEYSFPNLLARQLRIENFEQPTVSDPGVGGRLEFMTSLDASGIGQTDEEGSPTNFGLSRPYDNLGIPGAILADYLNADDGIGTRASANPIYSLVLRDILDSSTPSIHSAVAQLEPTLVSFWLGNNDILGYVTSGGLRPFNDPTTFQALYTNSIAQIKGLPSSPTVVALNIPDVASIPFATTVGPQVKAALEANSITGMYVKRTYYAAGQPATENRAGSSAYPTTVVGNTDNLLILLTGADYAEFFGVSANTQAPTYNAQAVELITDHWIGFLVNAGVFTEQQASAVDGADDGSCDFATLEATLDQVDQGQYLQTFGNLTGYNFPGFDFDQPFGLHPQNPFPNQFVLDDLELTISDAIVTAYNQVIAGAGDVVVDINSEFSSIVANGSTTMNGVTLTPTIGSMFSLDGVHPSNQGHVVVTNIMIDAINEQLNSDIPKVDIRRIPQGLPVGN